MERRGARAERAPRPALEIFSPLPPMRTGIGDYTAALLPLLAERYRCTVVTDDTATGVVAPAGVRVVRRRAHEAAEDAGAVALYMVGNNPDHLYMLPLMDRRPGVVVLHDPGLHHLLDCATSALGDADGYCDALEGEYGAPGRLLGEQWRRHALRDRWMVYDMPMLRLLAQPALHVVVHSRFAAHKVLSQAPRARLTVAPHPYFAPRVAQRETPEVAALRARLGIAPGELVFVSLGFVSHIKRIDSALRALARVASRLPPFRYVIAGEVRPEELDVARLVRSLGLGRQVVVTDYVAAADMEAMILLADVVINLRHPVGGETSGTLIRALGAGACVVVVDEGPFAEIPDGAAVKLAWGPQFETDLADALLRLAISPRARREIGAAAAARTARHNAPARSLAAYCAAIDDAAERWVGDRRRAGALVYASAQARAPRGAPLWRRLRAMPVLRPAGAVLARGDAADIAALVAMGVTPGVVASAAWLPWDEAVGGLDAALVVVAAGEALLGVPGLGVPGLAELGLAAGLNQMLRLGGVLVLVLRGSGSAGHVLGRRGEGEAALRRAGFDVELGCAAAAAVLGEATAAEPEGMVWRAVKVSDVARADG